MHSSQKEQQEHRLRGRELRSVRGQGQFRQSRGRGEGSGRDSDGKTPRPQDHKGNPRF